MTAELHAEAALVCAQAADLQLRARIRNTCIAHYASLETSRISNQLLVLQENLATVHRNKVQDVEQMLAASQLAVDTVRSEASTLREKVQSLQQEATSRASAASAASAAALQAQQVCKQAWIHDTGFSHRPGPRQDAHLTAPQHDRQLLASQKVRCPTAGPLHARGEGGQYTVTSVHATPPRLLNTDVLHITVSSI